MEIDRKERVPDILSKAMEKKIEVRNFKFETIDYDFVVISMNVAVKSLEEFKEIVDFFSSIPGVRKVVRS